MRLIDADALIIHLNDYALTEAPVYGRDQNTAVYEAIQSCMKAVEEAKTWTQVFGGWNSAKRIKPKPNVWVAALVKRHHWIADYNSEWVPDEEKTDHPEHTFITIAKYGKKTGIWQFLDIDNPDEPYMELEDYNGDEDLSMPLCEVLEWKQL